MTTTSRSHRDHGLTLVEIAVVVVMLGVLAAIVAFSLPSVAERADGTRCGADATMLSQVADDYMREHDVTELPSIGVSANRFELFLVDQGLIEQVSPTYDLAADGSVSTTGRPCT